MHKKIKFSLSESDIDDAIKDLEKYKLEVERRCELLRYRVGTALAKEAQMGFNGAVVEDLLTGEVKANVIVKVTDLGNVTVVVAEGEDAVWVEFGAGVYHNGSAGSSPNPYGTKLGMTIGGYVGDDGKVKGYGRQDVWGYKDEDGSLHLTHGTEARMPMALSISVICQDIYDIAREVFK